MAMTPNKQAARDQALAQFAWGFSLLPKHDGKQPAIHGNHLGWMREAMEGTALAWADGQAPPDDLRNALMETWWGQGIYQLYVTDVPAAGAGWKQWSAGGKRRQWWTNRHEVATSKLLGFAKKLSWVQASIEAVPGLSSAWPTSLDGPQDEAAWLKDCRDFVLHPEQYAALRSHLGLPAEEPPPPVEPEEPPTKPPADPPPPSGLRAKLKLALEDALDAESSAARTAALIRAALAELGGEP